MKKWLIFPVLLLLLLTACQTVSNSETEPTGSTPPSSSITPPPSSVVPPTSVPATTPPEPADTGYAFIYKGDNPFTGIDPDFSGCAVGHLYWIDIATSAVTVILGEPVLNVVQEGAYVYYVKADEPTKIYRTPIADFSQLEMIYESTHGKVSAMVIDTFTIRAQTIMQFVADNRKFVILDLETGEDTLLLEQYYIRQALFNDNGTNTWQEQNVIYFEGKPTKDDIDWDYLYYRDTGKVRLENHFYDN